MPKHLEKMDEAKSHLNFVFLDACRNNPFPRSVRAGVAGPGLYVRPDRHVAGLCHQSGQVATRRHRRNGAYTKHLLQHITQPSLEVGMLLRRVRTAVKDETGGQQVPWENGLIEAGSTLTACVLCYPCTSRVQILPPSSLATGTRVAVGLSPQQSQTPPATMVGNDVAGMVLGAQPGRSAWGAQRMRLIACSRVRKSDYEV